MSLYTKEIETHNFENILEVNEFLEREEYSIGEDHWGDGEGTYSCNVELVMLDPGYQLIITNESHVWDLT